MPTHTPRSKGTSNHYLVKIFAFAPGFPFFLLLFSLIMAHLLQTPTHQLIPIPLSLKNKNHTPPFKQNFVRYGWVFWNPIASQFTFKSSESWCVDGFFSLARSEFVRCTVNFSPLVWLAFFSQILFFLLAPELLVFILTTYWDKLKGICVVVIIRLFAECRCVWDILWCIDYATHWTITENTTYRHAM